MSLREIKTSFTLFKKLPLFPINIVELKKNYEYMK